MPIPTFDKMFDPLLALAIEGPLTRQTAAQAMRENFDLTEQEWTTRIPSGHSTYVRNRAGWAMTYLSKAGLIEKVGPKTYRATSKGITFRKQHPNGVTFRDVRALDDWWRSSRAEEETEEPVPAADAVISTATPAESLDIAIKTMNADLKSRLMEAILGQTPEFFEHLVLDLLVAMGYGGSRADAAEHLGQSGDEGIDGRIKQDRLGLDQILVQAKRYAADHPIDPKTIQAFVGSMHTHGVTKGVFITTSRFTDAAKQVVRSGASTRVVLVDGEELMTLMLRHHIGVRPQRKVDILELDQNYFSDEE